MMITAILLALLFAGAQEVEEGKWEGKYLDVRGYEGKVTLDLDVDGKKLSGDFKIEIADEESTQEITGSVTGTLEKEEVTLKLTPKGAKKAIELTATLRDADPYAVQAMYGNVPEQPDTQFGGGVWILWKFKG